MISPETYERILGRLEEKAKAPRKDAREDFPLRGFLLCPQCHHPYTSSLSKGRKEYYPYYRCMKEGCPSYNHSVPAEEVHAKFEQHLAKLKPRPAILAVVKDDLLEEFNRRLLTVAAVRKNRQKKLDDLDGKIKGLVDKIELTDSPTVIHELGQRVEVLKAQKLRLGGTVTQPKKRYDFETAVDRVFAYIENPLQKWKDGDLEERHFILRVVFEDALVYDEKTGFETAKLSLPLELSCVPELDRLEMVGNTGFEPVTSTMSCRASRDVAIFSGAPRGLGATQLSFYVGM